MSIRPISSVTCAALAVALLAGCDRQSDAPAQQARDASASASAALPSTIDRTFAGKPIPEVILSDPEGNKLALAETDGRPLLLNLWATWCEPCVTEMPLLDELAADLGDEVRVVTVNEDLGGSEAVEQFFADQDLSNLSRWLDPENDLAFTYGGAGLPITVLYDGEGREVWRVIGAYDWGSDEAREAVRKGARPR